MKPTSMTVATALVTAFTLVSTAWLATPTRGDDAADAATSAGPQLVAVKFHADWCGSCDAMGDVFTDLSTKLDSQPVLFVELDLTTSAGQRQAGYLMEAMGATQAWADHGQGTGFILLIDPDDMTVMNKMTKAMTFKQMVAAIESAMAGQTS